MRFLLTSLLLFFVLFGGYAQKVELIYQNENFTSVEQAPETPLEFEYIDAQFDLSDYEKLAEYKLTIEEKGNSTFSAVFKELASNANELGANAYSISDIVFEDNHFIVSVDLYALDAEDMLDNLSLYEHNIVVVFGCLNAEKSIVEKCKINKSTVEIEPFTYVKYQNKIDEKTTIAVESKEKGKASVSVNGDTHKLGRCFSLCDEPTVVDRSESEVAGNLAIQPVDLSFGLFVMTVLDSMEI